MRFTLKEQKKEMESLSKFGITPDEIIGYFYFYNRIYIINKARQMINKKKDR
jgi:hypothetical protein